MDLSNLHEIQHSILEDLGYEEKKSFSELQGDLPSNKVAFHLNQLQDNGVIEKDGDKYTTTKKGRRLIMGFLGEGVRNPITLLSLIICKDDEVYLEMQKSPASIFKNMYVLPTDKVRNRERLNKTAERIYRERIDEEAPEFKHLGVFDKEVELKDGVKQKYLLFYMKAEYEGDKTQNFTKIDDLEDIEIITGVDKVIKETHKDPDKRFVGEWNVKQTEEGFEITRFDI